MFASSHCHREVDLVRLQCASCSFWPHEYDAPNYDQTKLRFLPPLPKLPLKLAYLIPEPYNQSLVTAVAALEVFEKVPDINFRLVHVDNKTD